MTAHDGSMHWPRFTTPSEIRRDLQRIIDAETETDAWNWYMGATTIGAYNAVKRHHDAGLDVREAAKRALGEVGR